MGRARGSVMVLFFVTVLLFVVSRTVTMYTDTLWV